ncbi:hypothetical protein BJX76DRAFT_351112 [Aspergillus varians]
MDADVWFRDWKSESDQKLSKIQITRLVALTRQWKHERTPDTLGVWTSDPSEFWGFEPFHTESEWIRECLQIKLPNFKDCNENAENIEKISTRRRVLLVILHNIIQREKRRLQTSCQAQPAKFLTMAIKNVVEQAYPGGNIKGLRAKCTQLQRYGQKAKTENIEMEALVAFGEVTYDEKHQSDLQKAFECILNSCPFNRTGNLNPRLPSTSTRRHLRKKAARTKDTQKPSAPLIISHQDDTPITQN